MALCNNGTMLFNTGVRRFGATAYLSAFPTSLHGGESRTGSMRNLTAGDEGITSGLVGLPSGHRHPSAWMMPQKGGALASRNIIEGAGAFASAGTMGVNGEATLTGAGSLSGVGQLIISMVAALTGSGALTASAQAFLQLAATLAGAGDVDGALTAIAHAAAALEGDGDAAATATALGTLAAAITVTGDLLNSSNVGAAVWGAIAAVNNAAGTMGQALNAAGSAGDPWITTLPGAYTGTQAGALLDAINTLVDELHRIHGLNIAAPLEVTATSREAGAVTQTIVEAAGTVTVTRT